MHETPSPMQVWPLYTCMSLTTQPSEVRAVSSKGKN